jgi:hypothetical protein
MAVGAREHWVASVAGRGAPESNHGRDLEGEGFQ